MVTEEQLARTNISLQYDLEPSKNVIGDLSGLLGGFFDELLGAFYPRTVSKKANVAVTELFNNAIENSADAEGKIRLKLAIDGDRLVTLVAAADLLGLQPKRTAGWLACGLAE